MSLIQQLARLRLTSGALRNQVGKQYLSSSQQLLRSRNSDDNDNACSSNKPQMAEARDERVAKRTESLKNNDKSALKKKQDSKSSPFFEPINYQAGNGAAGVVHPTAYPSRDNELMKGSQSHQSCDNYPASSSSFSTNSGRDLDHRQKNSGQLNRPTVANQRDRSPSPLSSGKHKSYNLRTLRGEGDITKGFDNIKVTDTEGGIISGRKQAPPEGHVASGSVDGGSSVMDAVKKTGHNIMDKMIEASETIERKTIEAGHNLANQAKNAIGVHSTRMPLDIAKLEARHEPLLNRFSIRLNDNNDEVAVLQYRKPGDNSIDYYYTEVPTNYRGNGIGSILARAALDHAANNHLRMKLSCSYLRDYLNKNPSEKYKRIVLDR